jgi:signal transduction histidine kinase
MMSISSLVNFAIVVSAFIISVLGLLFTLFIRKTDRKNHSFFLAFFLLLVGYTASAVINELADTAHLSQITMFLYSLFSSLLIPVITVYLLHCAGKDWRHSPLFAVIAILWTVYFALLLITQFTTWIYYFTPDNVYHRGPWYPLLLIPPVLLMAANLIGLWRFRAALTRRQTIAFLIYFVVPLVCMLIQMFFYGLLLIVFGTTLAVLFMFIFLLSDQVDQMIQQAEENASQRASINVLQMRPHFICNTMMSIYYLIAQDTEKARQVTLDFTTYLRKNFTAIAKGDTIPFVEELEHTRAYLAVEKVRHENKLYVELDTPYTSFRIPALTLQPIVENAVVHGVSPDLEPLYLSVLTRETEAGGEIIVEDTGPGFAPADDHEPHIALANIRERLEMMCDGTLEITSRETGGTKVTIRIPLKDAE